jgi:hypothetical protein
MKDDLPPLKLLHSESMLVASELIVFERQSTNIILASLLPGQECCLKARPDGTILEGNHRIHVLQKRGVDVDKLPREIVTKTELA